MAAQTTDERLYGPGTHWSCAIYRLGAATWWRSPGWRLADAANAQPAAYPHGTVPSASADSTTSSPESVIPPAPAISAPAEEEADLTPAPDTSAPSEQPATEETSADVPAPEQFAVSAEPTPAEAPSR